MRNAHLFSALRNALMGKHSKPSFTAVPLGLLGGGTLIAVASVANVPVMPLAAIMVALIMVALVALRVRATPGPQR